MKPSTCFLCRQGDDLGSSAFSKFSYLNQSHKRIRMQELSEGPSTASKCTAPCIGCKSRPVPSSWWHWSCDTLLLSKHKSEEAPCCDKITNFANAAKAFCRPLNKKGRDTAYRLEGLVTKWAQLMEDNFRQHLFLKHSAEIQPLAQKFIGPCPYLIVLGESRRPLEYFRNNWEPRHARFSLSQDAYLSRIRCQIGGYIGPRRN